MALVAIVIKDTDEDGVAGVEVNVRSDSEINEESELTLAQGVALATTGFIASLIGDGEEDTPAPSLEVVGDVD